MIISFSKSTRKNQALPEGTDLRESSELGHFQMGVFFWVERKEIQGIGNIFKPARNSCICNNYNFPKCSGMGGGGGEGMQFTRWGKIPPGGRKWQGKVKQKYHRKYGNIG